MKFVIFAFVMTRKTLPITALFLLCAAAITASAQEAQEKSTFRNLFGMAVRWAVGPKKSLDSAYVLQPRMRWMVAVDGNTIRTGADLTSDIAVSDFREEAPSVLTGKMDIGMTNRLYKKVGLSAAFGSLDLGYGIELGKKSAERNTYFSLGSKGSYYGFQAQYYKTHQHVSGLLTLEGYEPVDLSSTYPGEMRNLSLSGFYAFNRHRFVFSSAYKGRILQRRSAGSWLVTAKYMQGDFSIDPADVVLKDQLNGLYKYSTRQVSLGGGYSFNWVIFHRDPYDYDNWKGLRNLTMNVTLMPMLSLLNHIRTEQEMGVNIQKVRYGGQPTLSPVVRSALCYAWSRYYLNVQAMYSRFSFLGADTDIEEADGHLRTKIRTQGVFYDLSAQMQFGVRF